MRIQILFITSFVVISGCGIKGPPLPPVVEPQPATTLEQPKSEAPAAEAIKTIKKKKKTK